MSQELMIDERIKEVANRIKSVREDLGFTVEQMAKKQEPLPRNTASLSPECRTSALLLFTNLPTLALLILPTLWRVQALF